MSTEERYSTELRETAVRLADEQVKDGKSQWAAMQSISQRLCHGRRDGGLAET